MSVECSRMRNVFQKHPYHVKIILPSRYASTVTLFFKLRCLETDEEYDIRIRLYINVV